MRSAERKAEELLGEAEAKQILEAKWWDLGGFFWVVLSKQGICYL